MEKKLSPSRTYVAMCNKSDFSGFYFKKFSIPLPGKGYEGQAEDVSPSWYFLNVLNFVACLEEIIIWEDFQDLQDQT